LHQRNNEKEIYEERESDMEDTLLGLNEALLQIW